MISELFGSLVTGVLSGGATGLLGVGLQLWGEQKKRAADLELLKQNHLQAVELRKLDIANQERMASLSAASAERLAELEAMARADEAASGDYRESLKADRTTYLSPEAQRLGDAKGWWAKLVTGLVVLMMGTVDLLRGIIRPGITGYSMALQTLLLLWVHDLWQRQQLAFSVDLQTKIAMDVIGTTSYLVTTTTVWWFGVRPVARK